MITIYTRQNEKGKWWCNTHTKANGEFFVEADTPYSAQELMEKELDRLKNTEDRTWMPVEFYPEEVKLPEPPIKSQPWRLDQGMV